MTNNLLVRAIKREIQHYPGVAMELVNGGKHDRIVFSRGEDTRFLTIPKTPSDWRAGKNAMRDFRKTMSELSAQRLEREAVTRRKRARRKPGPVAIFSLNANQFSLNIGADSKLIDRFMTADGKAAGQWAFELKLSPDLEAPPMIVVKRVELPPGVKVRHGVASGFKTSDTGAWRVIMARSGFPALSKKVKGFRRIPAELYEDNGDELVFKLPPGTIPTSFRKREETPLPSEAFVPKPEPVEEPAQERVKAKPEPLVSPPDQPMILQFPKQTVSIEQALAVLNKAKRRLGRNLTFTVIEDGFLTAVHRIGH